MPEGETSVASPRAPDGRRGQYTPGRHSTALRLHHTERGPAGRAPELFLDHAVNGDAMVAGCESLASEGRTAPLARLGQGGLG
jgi:hypothetical protein